MSQSIQIQMPIRPKDTAPGFALWQLGFRPFFSSGNRRNYFFVALLLLMAGAVLAVHLDHLGLARLPGWLGIQIALDAVLFTMSVMAGRVIPMFTNKGIEGANASRDPLLEQAALGSVLLLLAADALQLHGAPLVWVLHLAYFWIPVHLALRGFAELGWVSPSAAIHALTAGAAGGLIIGMMTRIARGHTGRPLLADRWDSACYLLVWIAAVVRVAVPHVAPQWTIHAVLCSAALWSAGFGLYAVRYWPVLTRARVDGRQG